jgi:hypothetical protein
VKIPVVRGLIDRRILVNFRIDPEVLANQLPPPFRPKIVNGFAIGGICLIRLKQIRPRFLPRVLGTASENAAHRFAVEWDLPDGTVAHGVYIARRDSSSRLNTWAGGRLFPGVHHLARFRSDERDGEYRIEIESNDGKMYVDLFARVASSITARSVFETLDRASDFFERGSVGYSDSRTVGRYDALELRCFNWSMPPLAVERIESSFFNNRRRFPDGSVEFDSALLMRRIEHERHEREPISADLLVAQ